MINAIEMSREELEEIFKNLPPNLRKKFEGMIRSTKPDSGIEYLREFVAKYEDDDMFDHIVAHTLSNLFRKMADATREMIKDKKNRGKKGRINTIEMGIIAIECMKNEAKNIQEALDDHESDCKKGDDCGAKH